MSVLIRLPPQLQASRGAENCSPLRQHPPPAHAHQAALPTSPKLTKRFALFAGASVASVLCQQAKIIRLPPTHQTMLEPHDEHNKQGGREAVLSWIRCNLQLFMGVVSWSQHHSAKEASVACLPGPRPHRRAAANDSPDALHEIVW